jgi:adenylyltransferase/sulfurtransferase
MTAVTQVAPAELKGMMDARLPLCLLDVREDWELALASIPGAVHIPLAQIPGRLKDLDAQSAIIVLCKAGGRSQMAAEFLVAEGFTRVSNLSGGILGWSRDVDPSVPLY